MASPEQAFRPSERRPDLPGAVLLRRGGTAGERRTPRLVACVVAAVLTLAVAAPGRAELDHFLLYKIKPSRGSDKFVKRGPVRLIDQFRDVDFDVIDAEALAVPANKNNEGIDDAATHLVEYRLKQGRGSPRFDKLRGVRVLNQCSDLLLDVKKPVSLLVPAAKSLVATPPVPQGHDVDHFVCYAAALQPKLGDGTRLPGFPTGIQVNVSDQFQTRRYDVTKLTKVCTPADKSGAPLLLTGSDKGNAAPLVPAAVRHPDDHLVCYQVKLARRFIVQNGCGAVNEDDRGTEIDPEQAKHEQRLGVFVATQLGDLQVDTQKELELCIPSLKTAPTPTVTVTKTPKPSRTPKRTKTPTRTRTRTPTRTPTPTRTQTPGVVPPTATTVASATPTPTPSPSPTPTSTPTPPPCALDDTQSPPVCGGSCPSPEQQCVIGEGLLECNCTATVCATQDPAEGVCNGGCPRPDLVCRVTPEGSCQCVPATDACRDLSPALNLENGICGGLCPRPEETCRYDGVTGGERCLCLGPLASPDTPPQPCGLDTTMGPPVCAGTCPDIGEVCEDTGGEGCECSPPPSACGVVSTADGGAVCGGVCENPGQKCIFTGTPEEPECRCEFSGGLDDAACKVGFVSSDPSCFVDHCSRSDLFCQVRPHDGACDCLPRYQRPCTLVAGGPDINGQSPPPVCLGVCPNGEVCVDVGTAGEPGCSCEPIRGTCGLQADGACGGPCPRPGDVCVGSRFGDGCGCVPPAQACRNESGDPEIVLCGGGCPRPGDECRQAENGDCGCRPLGTDPSPTPTEAVVTPPMPTPSLTPSPAEPTSTPTPTPTAATEPTSTLTPTPTPTPTATSTRTSTPTATPTPAGPPCGDTQPTCNGACPGTDLCRVGPTGCECMPACPEIEFGACDGACPFGQVCTEDTGGDCDCRDAQFGSKPATADFQTDCPTQGSIILLVDTFIPNAAQNAEQIRLGSEQLCPGAKQHERVMLFRPGETPPFGQTPPDGSKTFRRKIEIGNATEAVPLPIIEVVTFFDVPL